MMARRSETRRLFIDAVCPLIADDGKYLDWYREGGVTTLAPTLGSTESSHVTLSRLARWHRLLREDPSLFLVRTSRDVRVAAETGRLGVYFHIQGTDPIETNLDLIDLYKTLGVGMIQLTYNVRNRVGDGCEEERPAGLSRFGRRLVERLNAARIIIDVSHTSEPTAMDAVEHSAAPIVISHSDLAKVHASLRNVSDTLVAAVAATGGVVGMVGFPAMISPASAPRLDDLLRHVDEASALVGTDHIALGLDYYAGQSGVATDTDAIVGYNDAVAAGIWGPSYPPPPHHYPAEISTPRCLAALPDALARRGYSETAIANILGLNWLRVFESVWG
jgi:membrane dipeptidase